MSKYELTISPDYVSDWSLEDAIRELFQNALDQETINPSNKMFFEYDEQGLRLGNQDSILDVNSLLLGVSTKRDDVSTIGKFGEGYKIAVLVLLRLGKEITFYNYGKREVWKPRLVNSRRYNSKILTFFVDKNYFWQTPPDRNLTIEIKDITFEEYENVIETNLHLQNEYSKMDTSYGEILTQENHKGCIYVKGLFVKYLSRLKYGYNIHPQHLPLDRDRKMIADFDIQYKTAYMWAETKSDEVINLAERNAPDVAYLNYHAWQVKSEISDKALTEFKEKYGENAIPVTNEIENSNVPSGSRAVMVSHSHSHLIKSSCYYTEPEEVEDEAPTELLQKWFDSIKNLLDDEKIEEFEEIYEKL